MSYRSDNDREEITADCKDCHWNLYRYKDSDRNRKMMDTRIERHEKLEDHNVKIIEHGKH